MALPMPNDIFKKDLERFFKFLCNIKIHKLKKKDTVIQDYKYRGFKMTDYRKYLAALKSTWIRRILL